MNKSSSTVLGILAGTAIGAALGILFAPDKGSATRKRIADEANSAKDKLAENAKHLKENMVNGFSTKKQTLEDQVEDLVSDVSYKTEDVITALEKKLGELKEKNKKFQKA
ncbi:MAG: YtxH domain-containing protein [Flavobacteriaceae bacterium]|jgi:gas vesicle protein|nr:YtxH domain-containing protein [Mangrovimonas sp.]